MIRIAYKEKWLDAVHALKESQDRARAMSRELTRLQHILAQAFNEEELFPGGAQTGVYYLKPLQFEIFRAWLESNVSFGNRWTTAPEPVYGHDQLAFRGNPVKVQR